MRMRIASQYVALVGTGNRHVTRVDPEACASAQLRPSRRGARFLLALSALTVMLLVPASALAVSWAPVTGSTSIIQEIGKVRSPDGTLHVVWTRNTLGASTQDVLHAAVSASGVVGAPTVIASGFSSASNPAIVDTPGGGLEAFFGGIQCTSPGCPEGLFTATSSDGGRTWTTPASLLDRDSAYASDLGAATLSDGTPFETWFATLGVFVHRGLDPASPDSEYQGAMGAGCCGYYSNFAADGAGHMQLAWDSNATGRLGVWSQAVDPATGAASGSPLLMPGSVTSYNGAPSQAQMLQRTPIVARAGQAGQFYVAYPGGYPETTKVLLWHVGSGDSTLIANAPGSHDEVSLAADGTGRLWVFWAHSVSGSPHVFARRVGSAGLEAPIDMGAPAGSESIYKLDGDVSPAGNPEALALIGFANGTHGTYYARGPQVAAEGSLSLAVSTLKVTGGFVSLPLNCSSRLACDGRFSITTKAKIATKATVGKVGTVLCNTTVFRVKAGKMRSIKAKIYATCLSLLRHARGHRIKAQFTSRPRTRQLGVIRSITLRL